MQLIDILKKLVIEHGLIISDSGNHHIWLISETRHFTYSIEVYGTIVTFSKLEDWSTHFLCEVDMCNPNSIEELQRWLALAKVASKAWF